MILRGHRPRLQWNPDSPGLTAPGYNKTEQPGRLGEPSLPVHLPALAIRKTAPPRDSLSVFSVLSVVKSPPSCPSCESCHNFNRPQNTTVNFHRSGYIIPILDGLSYSA